MVRDYSLVCSIDVHTREFDCMQGELVLNLACPGPKSQGQEKSAKFILFPQNSHEVKIFCADSHIHY